jgi:hypothetical protein
VAKLILLLALLAFLYWGWRKLPPWRSWSLGRLGLTTVVALVVLLAAAGRLGWLLAAAGAAVALLVRLLPRLLPFLLRFEPELRQLWRAWRLKRSGGVTRFVRLGADGLDGEILSGPFTGRALASLSLNDVLAVYRECCQIDPDSALLLQAYLDRRFGAAWRRAYFGDQGKQRGSAPAGPGRMGREEAFAVLGLKPGASEKEIVAAHRRLMQKFHPDRGGSDDLAARINRAKDILLGKK